MSLHGPRPLGKTSACVAHCVTVLMIIHCGVAAVIEGNSAMSPSTMIEKGQVELCGVNFEQSIDSTKTTRTI